MTGLHDAGFGLCRVYDERFWKVFNDQEQNLTFVKTDFHVLKLKFHACNFKQASYPLQLNIAWPWQYENTFIQSFLSAPGCQTCMCKRGISYFCNIFGWKKILLKRVLSAVKACEESTENIYTYIESDRSLIFWLRLHSISKQFDSFSGYYSGLAKIFNFDSCRSAACKCLIKPQKTWLHSWNRTPAPVFW